MPVTRDLFTVDPGNGQVVTYTDALAYLPTDNYDCFTSEKPIGDIVNSTPLVVGAPPFYYPFDGYQDFFHDMLFTSPRDSVIYIGANDGALHAFDLTTGKEKWAFIPQSMHAKLNLAGVDSSLDRCELGYCHQYFVDGSPQAGDVYANFDGFGKEWRTILITGERKGGEAYFALDVTSGKSFDEINPHDRITYLWEFTDDELGQTWNDPAIERVSDGGDTAWGVYFGSGYSSTDQANKTAYLYGIKAHDASMLWKDKEGVPTNRIKVSSGSGNLAYDGFVSSFLLPDQTGETLTGATSGATGTIANVNVIVMYSHGTIDLTNVTGIFQDNEVITSSGGGKAVANGTLSGLSNDALSSPLMVDMEPDWVGDRIYTGNLYGDMFRVTNIGKDQVPVVEKLFSFNSADPQPGVNAIRAKADFAYSETDGEIWLYFGTGIYETQNDKINTDTQYFFGLKDDTAGVAPYNPGMLVPLAAQFTTANIDGQDVVLRTVSGVNPDNQPWMMELSPGVTGSERVLVKPLVVGGIVFFTTFVPDVNVCEGSGDTWLFAVNYNTGTSPTEPIFDLNGDGVFDDNDKVDGEVPAGIHVGRGQGSHAVLHKDTLFITTTGAGDDDTGGLTSRVVNIDNRRVRVEAWREH
jgi:Tfp pilus tip-associated adhesin PilY1